MTNLLVDEATGLPIEEVEPGSANDPFTAHPAQIPSSAPVAPSPAPVASAEETQNAVEGKAQTPNPTTQPSPQPQSSAGKTPSEPATPEPVLTPLEQAIKDGTLEEYIAGASRSAAAEAAEAARREAQSLADKRMSRIEEELKAAREKAKQTERDSKLNNEDLTEEEREILTEKWKLEDERAELDEYRGTLDDYFREQLVADLLREKSQFGVTEAMLREIDDPDVMIKLADDAELAFYRNGGVQQSGTNDIPSRAPEASSTPVATNAPAGATAPADLPGDQPVSAQAPKFDTRASRDALADNLKNMEWETLVMPA